VKKDDTASVSYHDKTKDVSYDCWGDKERLWSRNASNKIMKVVTMIT